MNTSVNVYKADQILESVKIKIKKIKEQNPDPEMDKVLIEIENALTLLKLV